MQQGYQNTDTYLLDLLPCWIEVSWKGLQLTSILQYWQICSKNMNMTYN